MYDGRAEEVVPVNIRLQSMILVCRPTEQRIACVELEPGTVRVRQVEFTMKDWRQGRLRLD